MNEIQFNAVKEAEVAARELAERFDLERPTFYDPHGDSEITMTRALIAEAAFLEEMISASLPVTVEAKKSQPVVKKTTVRGKKA